MWHENRLPVWLTVACLAFICAVAIVRVVLVRDRPIDRRINHVAVLTAITVLLREPAIAERLAPLITGGALVIFDLWHFSLVLLVWLIQALFMELLVGPERARRWRHVGVAVSVVYGAAFLALSYTARARGLLVQDAFGWQYPTYFGIYVAAIVANAVFAFCVCLPLWRHAKSFREKAVYVVLILSAVVTLVNMSLFYSGVLIAASGSDSAFARETEVRAGGELMLPNMALIMLLLVPSCVRALVGVLHVSRADRELRQLSPMWQDLTSAVPEVVLRLTVEDQAGATSAEKLHGMRTEVQDAIAVLSRDASVWPRETEFREQIARSAGNDAAVRSATELLMAAQATASSQGSRPPVHGGAAEDLKFEVDRLAQAWPDARRIAAALSATHDYVRTR